MDERIDDLVELMEIIKDIYIDIIGGKYEFNDLFMHRWGELFEVVRWMLYQNNYYNDSTTDDSTCGGKILVQ